MIVRIVLVVLGTLLILTSGLTERPLNTLLDMMHRGFSGGNDEIHAGGAAGTEEDLLDNRKKWKILITGYIIFAIYAVVSIGAIFTLNRKINTLYGSITSMEKSMQEMQDNAGSTVSDNGN